MFTEITNLTESQIELLFVQKAIIRLETKIAEIDAEIDDDVKTVDFWVAIENESYNEAATKAAPLNAELVNLKNNEVELKKAIEKEQKIAELEAAIAKNDEEIFAIRRRMAGYKSNKTKLSYFCKGRSDFYQMSIGEINRRKRQKEIDALIIENNDLSAQLKVITK